MSIFSKLLGSDKIVTKGLKMIDDAFHTDQEQVKEHMEFLKLYEPFKVAQRYLAIIFSIPFAVLHFGMYSLRVAMWSNDKLQIVVKAIQDDMNNSFGLIVLTVVGFYFAGGAAEGIIKRFYKK